MSYTPTVLHTSIDGIGYLCGAERIDSWHERCMSDRFAKSLPKCEDCEEVKNQRFGVDTKVALKKEMSRRMAGGDRIGKSPDMERPAPIPNSRTVVSDYRRDA
jgi:hypothetical protein